MNDLDLLLHQLDDLLALLHARISPVTVIAAVMAAGGIGVVLVGVLQKE